MNMTLAHMDAVAFVNSMYKPSKEYIEECHKKVECIESHVLISDRTDKGFIARFTEDIERK